MTHLTEEQTRALARRFAVEIQHLEKCAECRSYLREVAAEEDGGYRAALTRAAEGTLRRLPAVRAEKAAAPDLLAELLAMTGIEKETALARLARAVTEQVDPRSCGGTAALADLEAYSFAMEGEALRASGDPEQALRFFAESRLHQE